tara:strand:+ start:948 stop:1097 length:150 start_codon:yes stop_codon:yes gene_type:complete
MIEKNKYPSFRKELNLPEPKTAEQLDKMATDEKLSGAEFVASLYDNVQQ